MAETSILNQDSLSASQAKAAQISPYNIIPEYPASNVPSDDSNLAAPENPLPPVSTEFKLYRNLIAHSLTRDQLPYWQPGFSLLSEYYTPLFTTGAFGEVMDYLKSPFYIPAGGMMEGYQVMWNVLYVGARKSDIRINGLLLADWVKLTKESYIYDTYSQMVRDRGIGPVALFQAEQAIGFVERCLEVEVDFEHKKSPKILKRIYKGTLDDYKEIRRRIKESK